MKVIVELAGGSELEEAEVIGHMMRTEVKFGCRILFAGQFSKLVSMGCNSAVAG